MRNRKEREQKEEKGKKGGKKETRGEKKEKKNKGKWRKREKRKKKKRKRKNEEKEEKRGKRGKKEKCKKRRQNKKKKKKEEKCRKREKRKKRKNRRLEPCRPQVPNLRPYAKELKHRSSSTDVNNNWSEWLNKGNKKCQLSRGSCSKEHIHEGWKRVDEKNPFPGPDQRARKKASKSFVFTWRRMKAKCNFLISIFCSFSWRCFGWTFWQEGKPNLSLILGVEAQVKKHPETHCHVRNVCSYAASGDASQRTLDLGTHTPKKLWVNIPPRPCFERMRRQRNQSPGFITSHSFRLRACFWLGFRLKFLLSLFLCSSHDLLRQVVRHLHRSRTLHNFCHLRLARVRGSEPEKKAPSAPAHAPTQWKKKPRTRGKGPKRLKGQRPRPRSRPRQRQRQRQG